MTAPGAPGTAADGFRVHGVDHPYQAGPTDPGQRPFCTTCGRERHQPPIPTQRETGDQ